MKKSLDCVVYLIQGVPFIPDSSSILTDFTLRPLNIK